MEISVEQMYRIENNGHNMGFLKKFMMENAGAAAVRRLVQLYSGIESARVLVLAGMGNNGGDAMVMARHLAGYGAAVEIMLLGEPDKIRTEEARWNWSMLEKMPSVTRRIGALPAGPTPDIIIDGMLGTGMSGDIRDPYAQAIRFINDTDCYTLAVDVPSGLDPETGEAATTCVRATATVTFHKMKRGIPKRPDLTGELYTERIGIPPEAEGGVIP